MGWLIALLVTVGFGGWVFQLRNRQFTHQKMIARLATELDDLRRSQNAEAANLRAILATMADGVMLVDSTQSVCLINQSLRNLLELRVDPVGQSVLQGIRDISFHEIVAKTFANWRSQQSEVSVTHTKPTRHLTLDATPIENAAGDRGVLLICRDITRLKQLEDVRRDFVANVSHELRTPLAIFQGHLENLLDNPNIPHADLIEVLQVLTRHSKRLNALVEDLLDLARLEARSEILCLELIEPQALVADTDANWQIHARKKNIQLSTECAKDAKVFKADVLRIEQVLNNLVENALKYTDAGGTVRLRVAPRDSGIEFRVEDTGAGIPPQDLPHIFERFYRADKARTREQGGTGLGLSIVKHIIHLHGGAISAESTYGKGTTVTVELPSHTVNGG